MTPEVASLLLRQHEALMEEGARLSSDRPWDREMLVHARNVLADEFDVCWGYNYKLVSDVDHAGSGCSCYAARCFRGEVPKCDRCQKFLMDDGSHYCGVYSPGRPLRFVGELK
jgi:hypothetical protein